jgi:hypothetical protein
MFEQSVDELAARDTLRYLADRRAAADAEEARLLLGVAHWADLHPSTDPDEDPEMWCLDEVGIGGERDLQLAGEGTPLVAEFALADLATTLRLTQGATRALMTDTLELRHRLPRCWARVHEGSLPAWRARRIAQRTTTLSARAADWVDRRVAPVAHRIGLARLERLIAKAIVRCDPSQADQDRTDAAQRRRVLVTDPDRDGIGSVWAQLDAPDADALDATLNAGARALAALGDTSSHDVRRAKTLGLLADPQAALDLLAGNTPQTRTDLVLYVHLDQPALAGDGGVAQVGGLPGGVCELALQTLRDWAPGAQITVKPVIDCGTDLVATGYRPTGAQHEQAMLKDPVCVFPWCDKPGQNHDLDHIEAYDPHGPPDQTSSRNLARLCRFHHRVKTHGRWRYQRLPDGPYLWTNHYGHQWTVDNTGTTPVRRSA